VRRVGFDRGSERTAGAGSELTEVLVVVRRKTAGQSHEAMFERGQVRGKGAAKRKCAAKQGIADCVFEEDGVALNRDSEGERVRPG